MMEKYDYDLSPTPLQLECERLRKEAEIGKQMLSRMMSEYAELRDQLAEANLAYKNIQNGILIKEANLSYFAEQNKQLKKLLREASGPMSYGHWSTDFRNQVERALK